MGRLHAIYLLTFLCACGMYQTVSASTTAQQSRPQPAHDKGATMLRNERGAASRLKRPSDVGELIDRNRAYEASSMSPVYIEREGKLPRHQRALSAEQATPMQPATVENSVWNSSPFSAYSVETASATPASRVSYRTTGSPTMLSEKIGEVDMTMPTPRLDPKLEPMSAVRFGRQDVEFDMGENSKVFSLPSPFLQADQTVLKAHIEPKQLDFGALTPKVAEKHGSANLRIPLDHNAPELEIQQAASLLLQAREELLDLKEKWKSAEGSAQEKTGQVAALLEDIANLEKEVHGVSTQKEALRSEVERSNQENVRLASELLQARANFERASQQHSALEQEKHDLESHLAELELRAAASGREEADPEAEVLLKRISDLHLSLDTYKEEKVSLWRRVGELQQHATDSEQLQVSQRQQLGALCRALEASEEERGNLVARLDVFANQQSLLQEQYESEVLTLRRHLEGREGVLRMELARAADRADLRGVEAERMGLEVQRTQEALRAGAEQWQVAQAELAEEVRAGAEAARRLREEKEEATAELGRRVEEGERAADALRGQLERSEAEKVKVVAEVEAQLQRELEREQGEARRLEEEAGRARAEVEAVQAELLSVRTRADEEIVMLNGKVEAADARAGEAGERAAALQRHIVSVEALLSESKQRGEGLETELLAVQQQLAQLQADAAAKENENTRLRREVEVAATETAEVQQELEACRFRLSGLEAEAQEAAAAAAQLEEVRGELGKVQGENGVLRAREAEVREREVELGRRVEALRAEGEEVNATCLELRAKVEAAEAAEGQMRSQVAELEAKRRAESASVEEKERAWRERAEQAEVERAAAAAAAESADERRVAAEAEGERCREQLAALEAGGSGLQAKVEELEARCGEADKAARTAARAASRELAAAQAETVELRQQLEGAERERERADAAREAVEAEWQSARVEMQREAAEADERYRSLRREMEGERTQRRRREEEDGGREEEAAGQGEREGAGSPGGAMLQSVVAQRTRGRINDSARQARVAAGRKQEQAAGDEKPEEEELSAAHGAGAGEKAADSMEQAGVSGGQQSVVAKRTRGRTAEKEHAFFLKHVPVAGAAAPVKIPEKVPLSHTGFVIGRVGSDLVLNSGYVSRKHAQLQRTATGWRVLDTSTNGLCVNGVKVKSRQLSDGDVLLFEVPQTVGFNQEVPQNWDEKSHFRFRFCVEPVGLR